MRVTKLSVIKLTVLLTLAAALSGCSMFHKRENLDALPVDKLYANAHTSLEMADYAAAERVYQRLIARFPSGPYAMQAQLDLAYAQYKDNQPDDAYSSVNRYIKNYPTSKHVDYAYYLRGLINFDRTTGILERWLGRAKSQIRRDQGYNLQAFDDFAELSRRFPDSAYAADARQRMIYLRNIMAQFEVYVAAFYLHNKAYIASADRAQYVVEHYQQSPSVADALAILAHSYAKIGQPALSKQIRSVLALNYPKHPYLKDPGWPHDTSVWLRAVPFSGHN